MSEQNLLPNYQGILFPDRAESLQAFQGYKVFLDHWTPLAKELRAFYEGLALRRETRCLAIFGPQGSGKTLFARKLVDDFNSTRDSFASDTFTPNQSNLWQRITSGGSAGPELVKTATLNTELFHIENDVQWVEKAKAWKRDRLTRHCIIIADNAERSYFIQSLLNLNENDFLQQGSTPAASQLAAQRFVALAREELRGCLFIVLSNNDLFLLSWEEAIEAQHSGLMQIETIPLPSSRDKETVIRVNTNRLNHISYWYCLDKAGREQKANV